MFIHRSRLTLVVRGLTLVALPLTALAVACSNPAATAVPTGPGMAMHDHHVSGPLGGQKGYIAGWFKGEEVELYYTKAYFCAEPPSSGAATHCEVGAAPEVNPRPGPIPKIYAIAPAGFLPDLSTLSCQPGSVCLNHPAMLDVSRVAGPGATNVPALPHSHVVDERVAGWHETVNIRVFRLDIWNTIAAARSLKKMRELQADPAVGGAGLISADTPTNIFFFIASWRE